MLRISKLADYACIVMMSLAKRSESLNANELAYSTRISLPTVRKVLKLLQQADFLNAVRGVQGGYQLKKPAGQISVLEIVEAIDGPLAMTDCANPLKACEIQGQCMTQSGWQLINQTVRNALKDKMLEEWVR